MPSLVHMRQRNRTLTQAEVDEIKLLLSRDCSCCGFRPTQEQVARKMGIARSTVAKVNASYFG